VEENIWALFVEKLISKIYKELIQLNSKKKKTYKKSKPMKQIAQLRNGQEFKQTFLQKNTQIANRCIKRFSYH
jgi:hypothetical protein